MALEERLVGADVLVAEHALARLEFGDAIDQQERVAVRQHAPDFGDVDRHGHGCGHQSSLSRGVFSRALTRRASVSSCLKRAAFLRHSRFCMSGVPEDYSPGSRLEWVTRLIAVIIPLYPLTSCPMKHAPPPTTQ